MGRWPLRGVRAWCSRRKLTGKRSFHRCQRETRLGQATLLCLALSVLGCGDHYKLQNTNNGADGQVPENCGNGALDPGEFCDGLDLNSATCNDYGYDNPVGLTCTVDCHLNPSGCIAVCGNGKVEPSELCDDGNGEIRDACPDGVGGNCAPALCGDGIIWNGVEECDGLDLGGLTCLDFGYAEPAGLACTDGCTLDTSGCQGPCGDGVAEGQEACDGSDLAGQTCQDFGYVNPAGLACTVDCQADLSGCIAQCGNGVHETDEECDDGNSVEWDGCTTTCLICEFLVNTHTTGDQRVPAVAVAADATFVVVWASNGQVDRWDVFGQRYDAQGQKVGGEFQVNTETAEEQQTPDVATTPDGSFLVVWQSKNQDGDNWGIFGQRYDAQGNTVGIEFQVNTSTASEQRTASVRMAVDGSFVVMWESKDQDGDGWGIFGQRYDAQGTAVGSEFQVNTFTVGDQRGPSVGVAQDGSFVGMWESDGQDGSNWGVFGQRYNGQGVPAGSEFLVNTHTPGPQTSPSVGVAQGGSFVVVWQSGNQGGTGWDIFGQRWDAQGVANGGEFQVNTYTSGHQGWSSVAAANDGSFVVVWQSIAQDGDNYGIFGQRFDLNGVADGIEFQVNLYTPQEQQYPAVAVAWDGSFVVVWESHNQVTGWGIFGQRYDPQGLPKGLLP